MRIETFEQLINFGAGRQFSVSKAHQRKVGQTLQGILKEYDIMKIWKTLFYFLAIIPLTFIVSLMTFYFKAGQVLGHAPSYNNPDPKELDIYKVYAPYVDWTAAAWLYSLLVWFGLTIIYLLIMRKRIDWIPIIISGTGQVLGILLVSSGIFEWYID